MGITKNAKLYHERMFPNYESTFLKTDPEFVERFDNFAFDEVIQQTKIDEHTRYLAILASLIGCQGIEEFQVIMKASFHFGVTPIEIKEMVYQSSAYLGMGRVLPFFNAINQLFIEQNIELPLAGQATTTTKNRFEKGSDTQVAIFGETMRDFATSGAKEQQLINKWLVEHCFGDFYTRTGLTLKQRELITLCFLVAQGGCENQVHAHLNGNLNLGYTREELIHILANLIPYIGYPRVLNGLAEIQNLTV